MKTASYAVLGALALPITLAQTGRSGCYTSIGDMEKVGTSVFQSTGSCMNMCGKADGYYYAIKGEDCWCGKQPPAFETVTNDRACNLQCPGYPHDYCGGNGVYSVGEMPGDHPSESSGGSTTTASAVLTTKPKPTTTQASSAGVSVVPSASAGTIAASSSAVSTPSNTPLASAVPANSTSGANRRFRMLFI
ncbi:uncharacterized protein BO97DRAFT_442429 [Aspergillus homomorphus CBS 101889]|uniref:WSC domain-containing protein n=1 Tax=Aspergillus homomorphus (strain CBS 101889) TaxID=1450537 RepID=A0A395I021_ASPHC|nr:hypothetical protein BO97DRAFT_442429 [Aspergillus homomorphus CBS 101889]RAL13400.1 hypothetical protein BO97DRAFT_442429 [Aspergillus homomorphus CBS 101889]